MARVPFARAVRRIARRSDRVQDLYEWWKNSRRRTVLEHLVPPGGVGAELGVHKGHLTPHLVRWWKPARIYVVDPWFKLEAEWSWAAGDKSTVNAVARVFRKMRPWVESGVAEIVIEDDRVFLSNLDDASLDWAYLDSSHYYEHTVEELNLLVRKLGPSGVLVGDDWQPDPSHRHHGVFKAVMEGVEQGKWTLKFSDERSKQWAAVTVQS